MNFVPYSNSKLSGHYGKFECTFGFKQRRIKWTGHYRPTLGEALLKLPNRCFPYKLELRAEEKLTKTKYDFLHKSVDEKWTISFRRAENKVLAELHCKDNVIKFSFYFSYLEFASTNFHRRNTKPRFV